MKTRITFTAAMLAGTFLTGNAWAATIEVRDGGSIQAGINKAGSGDTVLVQPGTYSPFEVNRNGITVKSAVPGGAHVIATGGNQPAIASYGQDNIAILDFRLTSKNGDGVKIGGSASRDAKNIHFAGNTVESAAKDGLKFFQIKGMNLSNNTIKNAGTARNGNGDGGIDFVGVDNAVVKSNEIIKTYGHACFMMKGGSNGNTVTGNSFMGCERDGITVGGFTDANLMDSSDKGLEAHGNTVTGNQIQAGSGKCAFYYHKAANNTVSGNQTSGGRSGCSNSGGGASLQLAGLGASGNDAWLQDAVDGMVDRGMSKQQIDAELNAAGLALQSRALDALIDGTVGTNTTIAAEIGNALRFGGVESVKSHLINKGYITAKDLIADAGSDVIQGAVDMAGLGGGACSSVVMDTIASAGSAISGFFGGGRATVIAQLAQQVQLTWANRCAAEQNERLIEQLQEQRRMTASIEQNVVGQAGVISNGVTDTLKLSKDADMESLYQEGASADRNPDESLAYFRELRSRTDSTRRNALETAARNIEAEKTYAKMADDALALSQSAQGQTSAIQAQAQLDRAREGAAAARNSTQLAFEHARLMSEEEERAAERMGQQRRDRLYHSEKAESLQPFKLFQ